MAVLFPFKVCKQRLSAIYALAAVLGGVMRGNPAPRTAQGADYLTWFACTLKLQVVPVIANDFEKLRDSLIIYLSNGHHKRKNEKKKDHKQDG